MPTYRAYLLDPVGRITWGEWFEAADDAEAMRVGRSRCQAGVPSVEIWRGGACIWRWRCEERPTSRGDP